MGQSAMVLKLKRLGHILAPADPESAAALGGLADNAVYWCEVTDDKPDKKPRNNRHHRKYFALLKFAFDHWDVPEGAAEKSFAAFRKEITVLAGHYTQVWRLDGSFELEAKSVSFREMGQEEFEGLYSATVNVILKHVLGNYSRGDLERCVEAVLRYG